MKEGRSEAKAEADMALGASEQQVYELSSKLIVEERERKSVEVGLKTTEAQAKEQHKKLHYSKI